MGTLVEQRLVYHVDLPSSSLVYFQVLGMDATSTELKLHQAKSDPHAKTPMQPNSM